MPDDDLLPPTSEPPAPAAQPAPRGSRIVCEFCGCELDPRGNVLKRGEPARAYLDLEDENKTLRIKLDTEAQKASELGCQLEALQAPAERRGFLSDL